MSARRPHKARTAPPVLKGEPPVDPREKVLMQTLQRAADMEFALRETQAALRKVIHHVTTEAPSDAFRLGMCHAAAEEGLLRADSALGTLPARRRATDRPRIVTAYAQNRIERALLEMDANDHSHANHHA